MPRFSVDIIESNLYTIEVLADDLEDARLRAVRAASGPPQGSTREIVRLDPLNGHRNPALNRGLKQLEVGGGALDVEVVDDDELLCKVAGCKKPGPWKNRQALATHALRSHGVKIEYTATNGKRRGGIAPFADMKTQSREPEAGSKLRGVLDYLRQKGEVSAKEAAAEMGEGVYTQFSILVSRGWADRVGVGRYKLSAKRAADSNGSQASAPKSTANDRAVKWAEREPTTHGKTIWEYAKKRPKQTIDTDLAAQITGLPKSQASVYLSQLTTAGRLERVQPGVYRLGPNLNGSQASNGDSTGNGSQASTPKSTGKSAERPTRKGVSKEPAPGTQSREILDFVRANGDSRVADVQAALPHLKTISSSLARFVDQGWMERVDLGVYRAASGRPSEAAERAREKDRDRKRDKRAAKAATG